MRDLIADVPPFGRSRQEPLVVGEAGQQRVEIAVLRSELGDRFIHPCHRRRGYAGVSAARKIDRASGTSR